MCACVRACVYKEVGQRVDVGQWSDILGCFTESLQCTLKGQGDLDGIAEDK